MRAGAVWDSAGLSCDVSVCSMRRKSEAERWAVAHAGWDSAKPFSLPQGTLARLLLLLALWLDAAA